MVRRRYGYLKERLATPKTERPIMTEMYSVSSGLIPADSTHRRSLSPSEQEERDAELLSMQLPDSEPGSLFDDPRAAD